MSGYSRFMNSRVDVLSNRKSEGNIIYVKEEMSHFRILNSCLYIHWLLIFRTDRYFFVILI